MHHLVVEGWSQRRSALHSLHAGAKAVVLLVLLICISTAPLGHWGLLGTYAAALALAVLISGLPWMGLLLRALLVIPFTATFALLLWWGGDAPRAAMLPAKTILSALASLLLIATTPIPALTSALERLLPHLFVLVIQFIYRYLFVIGGQAQAMRTSFAARGAGGAPSFAAASGALGVLFVRSWEKADEIHHAMVARGFDGAFRPLHAKPFGVADSVFLAVAAGACVVLRVTL